MGVRVVSPSNTSLPLGQKQTLFFCASRCQVAMSELTHVGMLRHMPRGAVKSMSCDSRIHAAETVHNSACQ